MIFQYLNIKKKDDQTTAYDIEAFSGHWKLFSGVQS